MIFIRIFSQSQFNPNELPKLTILTTFSDVKYIYVIIQVLDQILHGEFINLFDVVALFPLARPSLRRFSVYLSLLVPPVSRLSTACTHI